MAMINTAQMVKRTLKSKNTYQSQKFIKEDLDHEQSNLLLFISDST